MFNNAGFSDKAYFYFRMRVLAQAAILTMCSFYGSTCSYIIDSDC